jgi:hypothetical protein
MIPRRPQLTSAAIGVALVFASFCHAAEEPGPSLRPCADVQWRAVPKQGQEKRVRSGFETLASTELRALHFG